MKSKHFERLRFLILCALIIVAGTFFLNRAPLSGDIVKILPEDEATRTLSLYNRFESSKKLFVMVRGFDEESLRKANEIKTLLEAQSTVENVFFNITDLSPKVQRYLGDNYHYLSDFNDTALSPETIRARLNETAEAMLAGGGYVSLDRHDPLKLFTPMRVMSAEMKNGFLIVPGKGYCLIASITPAVSDIDASREMYNQVMGALEVYRNDIVLFSPNFYGVENSAFIKNDVEKITLVTFVILVLVYFFLLRSRVLLLFSVTALVTSTLVALIVLKAVFPDVSILVVAFGAGIASIAEDYLFMMFVNDDYRRRRFNKQVFYGFAATEAALLSLVWIDFPLIAHLSLFTAVSLAVSYFIFAFVFPRLEFYRPDEPQGDDALFARLQPLRRIPPVFFLAVSIAMIAYAVPRITFDPNFRHLDYQNQKLLEAEALFNDTLGGEKIPVLLKAPNLEALLVAAERFRAAVPESFSIANLALSPEKAAQREAQIRAFDFDRLSRELSAAAPEAGFRSGIFDEAYASLRNLPPFRIDEKALSQLGIEIRYHEGQVMSLAYMEENELAAIEALEFATPIIGRELLSQSATAAAGQFSRFFLIATLAVLVIVVAATRKRSLAAINFLLFPVASILCLLSFLDGYNIMHLFALFLMMIYGVDYGIYLSREEGDSSLRAVSYSLITTFAGFGILAFSEVPAVYSIGYATLVALGAVAVLFFQKTPQPPLRQNTHS